MPTEIPKWITVLVVEDEVAIRRLLRICLERSGHAVVEAASGDEAIAQAIRCRPNAILLDLTLPDMNGLKVLERLREWSQVPVLVVSECLRESEKITALDAGANDYICKPFNPEEILARLRVVQRYAPATSKPAVFHTGDLTVDLTTRTVKVKGRNTKLTPIEYSMLRLFVQNAGKVLTHRQIFREIWGPDENGNVGYIRVYLTTLRSKLVSKLIVTEPGVGYRLVVQE